MFRAVFAGLTASALALGAAGCAAGSTSATGDGAAGAVTTVASTAPPSTRASTSAPTTAASVRTTTTTTAPSGPVTGTWTAVSVSGPYADALQLGGVADCTSGGANTWILRPARDGRYDALRLTFDPATPTKATVAITETGGSAATAEGTADVKVLPAEPKVLSFEVTLTYRDVESEGHPSGELHATGTCAVAPPA